MFIRRHPTASPRTRVQRALLDHGPQAHPDRPYLVLVDEINRGSVAKILGELLTLLERDKRGLTVSLPQSKETFSIPPNVYLLGTMNTADRSKQVAHMIAVPLSDDIVEPTSLFLVSMPCIFVDP